MSGGRQSTNTRSSSFPGPVPRGRGSCARENQVRVMFVRSVFAVAAILASAAQAANGLSVEPAEGADKGAATAGIKVASAATAPSGDSAPTASADAGAASDAPDFSSDQIEAVTVSARRVSENVQSVPIPIAVV